MVSMVSHLNSSKDIGNSLRTVFQLLSWSSSLRILAEKLSSAIPDLISDVQSAFIYNRQILDGPFILNELLSWCKYKKLKAMVFKVDFEKDFDSIRWDYLDDFLKSFSFRDKWCGWISGCLKSAKGSVLVNGIPTPEFQFHRGLKQGDPLSPFLFILIMDSLHLSFKKVINAWLFTSIPLDNSLTISHLFYVDDAIFIGKWDSSNLKIILKVLKCFHMASGLKININKSKLIGYDVHSDEVETAARHIGCATFIAPFSYLEVQVGGRMEKINSWDDLVSKVSSRLLKWKLKTLSIGEPLKLYMERKEILESMVTLLDALLGLISFERSMSFVPKSRRDFFYHVPPLQLFSGIRFTPFLYMSCGASYLKKVLRWWDLDENMIDSYDDWLLLLKNIRLPKRLKDLFEGVCYVKWWLICNLVSSGRSSFPVEIRTTPASMRTSLANSGVLLAPGTISPAMSTTSDSNMEELHAAIQAAIAHCKSSTSREDKNARA
nr:RNA-directed DNA polymerase, eukaryota [Tanacetum cinerariifolium]